MCRFDIEGYVTGFGNPDWAKTHEASLRTASVVLSLVDGGAKCIGKTTIDEMAYRYRLTAVLFLYFFFLIPFQRTCHGLEDKLQSLS